MTQALVTQPHDVDEIEGLLLCTSTHRVTHDVMDFVLEAAEPTRFAFEPGQHLTITVTIDGTRHSRCYSVSSPTTRPESLTITVKRVPGGPVSNWLHDHLRAGDLVQVNGPLGSFTPVRHLPAKQLHLTAGSGITPLMSVARTMVDERTAADVVLIHHARTPSDIVFRDELAGMSDQHPGIRVVLACEDDTADDPWAGHRGRISPAFLASVVPDIRTREIFLCGPPPYMQAARECLAHVGVDPARVHEESYVFAAATAVQVPQAEVTTTYTLEFRRSQRVVEVPGGTTVLEAATRAGLSLPSSCQEGVCGTCKTTMVSGSVEMNHAGGIRQREIDRGQILLCCSTPSEDLVLDA